MRLAALERGKTPSAVGVVVSGVADRDLPALYAQHYRALVKLSGLYLGDVESAEEVVQDAFVKLLSGRYQVEAGKEGPYLRSMVLNGSRSVLRKRHVRRLKAPAPPGDEVAAEEIGMARAERDRVVSMVRSLPHKQASVLMLRYYLELSEAEIAETLGIARGSVKSHAHRALAKLQTRLGDQP